MLYNKFLTEDLLNPYLKVPFYFTLQIQCVSLVDRPF